MPYAQRPIGLDEGWRSAMVMEVALGFPTVIFTVAVLVAVGYWVLVLAGGAELGDADLGGDAAGADADGGGPLQALMGGLHLTGVPPVVVISLVAVFGWLTCYLVALTTGLADATGLVRVGGGIGLLVVSLVAGLLASAVAARPLSRAFASGVATRSASLVGRTATVRTGAVTDDFGQAVVTVPGGGEVTVQVRTAEPNGLTSGSSALLIDYDAATGVFWVAETTDLDLDLH